MVALQDDWCDYQGAALHGAFDDSESRTADDACRLADGRACAHTYVHWTGMAYGYRWRTEGADDEFDRLVSKANESWFINLETLNTILKSSFIS